MTNVAKGETILAEVKWSMSVNLKLIHFMYLTDSDNTQPFVETWDIWSPCSSLTTPKIAYLKILVWLHHRRIKKLSLGYVLLLFSSRKRVYPLSGSLQNRFLFVILGGFRPVDELGNIFPSLCAKLFDSRSTPMWQRVVANPLLQRLCHIGGALQ